MRRIGTYIRHNLIAFVALFFALGGGAAWAANTIGSADIIDGQVRTADIGDGEVTEADLGQGAVASPELKNDSIVAGDVAPNSLPTGKIVDGSLTGVDVANNSLKGADVDESTLDVGDAGRAYAAVDPACTGFPPPDCPFSHSKGIAGVSRTGTGSYCVEAPGISPDDVAAAVSVDAETTSFPRGNASAMAASSGCFSDGFHVVTERLPGAGGAAELSNTVGFTIVIP